MFKLPKEFFLVAAIFLAIGTIYIVYTTPINENYNEEMWENEPELFCGISTNWNCKSDADCLVGGCSNQVCYSKDETPPITTCEYRDCYNADAYNKRCGCVNNMCQWSTPIGMVGIANPASEYCISQGGKLKIVEGDGQLGICSINGKECEEWAFYHGKC